MDSLMKTWRSLRSSPEIYEAMQELFAAICLVLLSIVCYPMVEAAPLDIRTGNEWTASLKPVQVTGPEASLVKSLASCQARKADCGAWDGTRTRTALAGGF